MSAAVEVRGLHAGYGRGQILQGVDLDLDAGTVTALLGRNGVGKTTLVHALMGLVRPAAGSVRFDGEELTGRPAHDVARRGVALVPQGRRVFTRLTVEENLAVAARGGRGAGVARVYDAFPQLRARRRHRGGELSGGEQQMLAIGRALVADPAVLLLDEPSEGLAPLLVEEVGRQLLQLRQQRALTMLLVEQNLQLALALADQVAVMVKGRIVHRSSVAAFRSEPQLARQLLGLS